MLGGGAFSDCNSVLLEGELSGGGLIGEICMNWNPFCWDMTLSLSVMLLPLSW